MWPCRYMVYFTIFSCMGWIYETIFCTIKGRKWENRGFLYGPVCPIYGVGASAIFALMETVIRNGRGVNYTPLQVFIVAFFGSIVLEYVTSYVLEKLFHAYWWDYSKMPFNIHGRVCLPCSIGFGFAGMLVVYVIAPWTYNMTKGISGIGFEFLGLIFAVLFGADTTLTVSVLTSFQKTVVQMEDNLNRHMEDFVENVQIKTSEASDAFNMERERFTKELKDVGMRRFSAISKGPISRIKGFRPLGKASVSERKALGERLENFRSEFLRTLSDVNVKKKDKKDNE